MNDSPLPKKDIRAREYLAGIFDPSDRLALLLRNPLRGETVQRIATLAKVLQPSFQEWLHFKNDREGCDVYVGMNPLKPAARTRTKDDILSIRHLYVDLDHDAAKSLAAIQRSTLVPQPNYVLSTSPDKFQTVWRVDRIDQEQAELLLRAMARKFGGDPAASDSTHVLRLPGFSNNKYEDSFLVRADLLSDRVYHSLDFKLRVERPDSYQPARRAPTTPTPIESLGQSGHDRGLAKDAPSRRNDPAEIVGPIAPARSAETAEISDNSKDLP